MTNWLHYSLYARNPFIEIIKTLFMFTSLASDLKIKFICLAMPSARMQLQNMS